MILEGMVKRECGAGSGTLCAWSFLRASFGSFGRLMSRVTIYDPPANFLNGFMVADRMTGRTNRTRCS